MTARTSVKKTESTRPMPESRAPDVGARTPLTEHDADRARLRTERERLAAEHQVLLTETERLATTTDVDVLRAHVRRLHEHLQDMAMFTAELEQFHHRFGPLGP